MTRQTCAECGTRMIDVGFDTHMSCEPSIAAEFRAHDRRVREAQRLAAQGKRRAVRNNSAAAGIALGLIRQAARRNEHLTPDTVADDFDTADIPMKARGGIWTAAVAAGVLEPAGTVPSARKSAHGKPVNRYRSLIYREAAA